MSFTRLTRAMRRASEQAKETADEVEQAAQRSVAAYDAVRQSIENTMRVANSGKEMADQLLASLRGGTPQVISSGGSALSPSAKSITVTSTKKTSTSKSSTAKLSSGLPRSPTTRSGTSVSSRAVELAQRAFDEAKFRGASTAELTALAKAIDLAHQQATKTNTNPATGRLGG